MWGGVATPGSLPRAAPLGRSQLRIGLGHAATRALPLPRADEVELVVKELAPAAPLLAMGSCVAAPMTIGALDFTPPTLVRA